MLHRLETLISAALIASRWLMAPLYLGLIAALVLIGVEFFNELGHAVIGFAGLGSTGVILAVLKLIDLVLIANLVLIMITAGIGTLETGAPRRDHPEWTEFTGKVDFAGLKLKVVVSLVAIAAVDLLENYVDVDAISKADLLWRIAIMMAFVVTGVLLAWMDRLAAEPHD